LLNPAIRNKREKNPTIKKFSKEEEEQPCHQEKSSRTILSSGSTKFSNPVIRSTLQLRNTKKFNLTIKKKSGKNSTIRKFSKEGEG
jgi:hypothetical protein